MIMPMTPPRNGLAPNTFAPEKPIRTGRKTYAVLENIFASTNSALSVDRFRYPLLIIKFSDSMMPIRKPDATIAGMIGTKMSPSVLINRWNGFPFCAAAALTSSLVIA